ncbi:uncharacterized protein [Rutidosis leptorrhynchoides]|uniref:uncharacterized protein n=1 Tax=Rutidosis leptorrhynchoides TaxID=125765 RepID=UPI003A9A4A1D
MSLSSSSDSWVWMGDGNKQYSVSTVRNLIDCHYFAPFSFATYWSNLIPIIVKVFIWRLRLHRLAYKASLIRRNVHIADLNCVWYGNEVESEEHIFLNCNISKQVWSGIASWLQIDLPFWQSIDILWIWIDNFPNSKNHRVIVQAIFIAALWNLWRLRNSYAFNDQKFSKSHV